MGCSSSKVTKKTLKKDLDLISTVVSETVKKIDNILDLFFEKPEEKIIEKPVEKPKSSGLRPKRSVSFLEPRQVALDLRVDKGDTPLSPILEKEDQISYLKERLSYVESELQKKVSKAI